MDYQNLNQMPQGMPGQAQTPPAYAPPVDHNMVDLRQNPAMEQMGGQYQDPQQVHQHQSSQNANYPPTYQQQQQIVQQTPYKQQTGIVNENLYSQNNQHSKYLQPSNPAPANNGSSNSPTNLQYQQSGQPEQANINPLNGLSNDLRSNQLLSGINDINDLASKYIDVTSKIPTPPASPNDYKWEAPNGLQLNQEIDSRFRDFAIKNGYSQEQYESLNNFVLNEYEAITNELDNQAMQQQFNMEKMETQNALREEWGSQYDHKMNKVYYALEKELGPEGRRLIEETELGTNPSIIKMVSKLSDFITEDSYHAGNDSQNLGNVEAKFNDVFGAIDNQNEYWDENSPGHNKAVQAMEAHFQNKFGGSSDINTGFNMGKRASQTSQQTYY